MNISGGTVTTGAPNWDYFAWGTGSNFEVGRSGGTGTVEVSGNGVLNVYGRTDIGDLANNTNTVLSRGSLTLSGNARMTTKPGSFTNGLGWGWTDGGDVYVGCSEWEEGYNGTDWSGTPQTLAGGVGDMTVKDNAILKISGNLAIGAHGGTGTFTIQNSAFASCNIVEFGVATAGLGAAGNGTLNLNGGVLATNYILAATTSGDTNVATVNLNGGTLRALSNQGDFLSADANPNFNVYVKANGVTFDTNSWNIALQTTLRTGTVGTDGGVTKAGTGNLTYTVSNGYTGPTTVQNGQLILTATPVFNVSGATRAISVNNQGTLGLAYNGGNGTLNALANLTVGGNSPVLLPPYTYYSLNKPVLSATTDGTNINCLNLGPVGSQTGTFSGVVGTTMVVDLVGNHDLSGMAIPVSSFVDIPVLTYSAGGATPPALLPRYAAVGLYNVSPKYSGNSVVEHIVNASAQGFAGIVGSPSNWFDVSNWYSVGGVPYTYANSPDAEAWFVEVPLSPGGTTCVLDQNATTNSMLFYASPAGLAGFSVVQSADPSRYILLSAVNSTTAVEAQIQVLGTGSGAGSVNQVAPDIHLGAPLGGSSFTQIYLGEGSTLALTGAISQYGVAPGGALTLNGGTAGLDIVGDASGGGTLTMSSTASSYTGPLSVASVDNVRVITGYLTPAHIAVTDSALVYTGSVSHTCSTGLELKGANVTIGVQNAGTTVSVPMDIADTRFLETQLTKSGNGVLQLTYASPLPVDPSLGTDLNITGGTVSLTGTPGVVYTDGDRFGPVDTGDDTNGMLLIAPNVTYNCNAVRLAGAGAHNTNVTVQGGTFLDNYWLYIGGHDGVGGTGTLTIRDTNFRTGAELSIGRDSGQGTVNLAGNTSMTIGSWFNVGCFGGAKGTLTLTDNASLTQNGGGSQELGCYSNGSYGYLKMDGHSTLTMAQGGNFEMASDWGTSNNSNVGTLSADMNIGGSATATFGGHFYCGVWNDSGVETHGSITLSDHGTLNVGTNNPEWTQLGYGNDAQTNTFNLTMSGTSTFNNGGNNFGMVYSGCSGSLTMSDSAQLICTGLARFGGGSLTANMSGSSQITTNEMEISCEYGAWVPTPFSRWSATRRSIPTR